MKVWAHAEEFDETDMNYLGSRLVHRYSNVDERTAAQPTPNTGSVAYVGNVGLTLYSGGAWRVMRLIPSSGTTGQVLTWQADGSLAWETADAPATISGAAFAASFDTSLAPTADYAILGEVDYATVSLPDLAYAHNLLLKNLAAVIEALSTTP